MRLRGKSLSTLLTAGVIAAGFVFSLAANWPGHISYDSVMQMLEGRTGSYNDWHPPVMAWLLGFFDWLRPGAGLFVLFNTFLGFGSLFAVLCLFPRSSWAGLIVALAAMLTPQFLIYHAIVWKDVLFADACVAGFALLALAAGYWSKPHLRLVLNFGGMALLVLASLARQNGLPVLLAGVVSLAIVAAMHATERKRRKVLQYGAIVLAIALAAFIAITFLLSLRVDHKTGATEQIARLQTYDMIGMIAANPKLDLSVLREKTPVLEEEIRRDGVRLYTPVRSDTLLNSPALQSAFLTAPRAPISEQWRKLVWRNPWTYLRVRGEIFHWVFLTPKIYLCVPFYTGVDGPPDEMKELGLVTRSDDRDSALADYAGIFADTPVLNHGFYAALAAIALIFLLKRRKPADIIIAGMLVGALAYTLSFFAISIACDYRYLYMLDLSAILAVFYLSLDGFGAPIPNAKSPPA